MEDVASLLCSSYSSEALGFFGTTRSVAQLSVYAAAFHRVLSLDRLLNCFDLFAAVGVSSVHCTLVDCPGHAGLIRTIIGGAQIIDMVCL